jgi:hypothetical protein
MSHRWVYLIVLVLLLAACSTGPREIASYSAGNRESYAIAPNPSTFVYDAFMEMEVTNPGKAAGRSQELAEAYGGYLVSSQTYDWNNQEQVTVLLAVPAGSFERLHKALLRLGQLKNEHISGEWEGDGWGAYSEVTVNFLPSGWAIPDLPHGWNPGSTFRRALDVFITIFGFLVDILIWVAVVAGPFVLLAWGILILAKRLRRKA